MTKIKPIIKKVLTEFNNESIKYCVLRNYEFLLDPNQPPGFDFDVSIAEEDKQKVERIFAKNGFIKKPPQFSHKHQGYSYFSKEDLKKLGFDVQWNGVVWNDMYYLKNDIYSQRKKVGFLYTVSDEDAFIMYLCHSILGKRFFKEKYRQKLQELAKKELDFTAIAQRLNILFKNKRAGKMLIEQVKANKFDEIIKNRYHYIKRFILWNHLPLFIVLFFRWINEKVIKRPQPLIAFIGPDGAGKSTTAERIKRILEDNDRKVAQAYLGRGKSHLLPINKTGRAVYEKIKNKKPGMIIKILYTLAAPVYTTDLLLRYLFVVRPKRKRAIVITDRYCTDIYLMPRISNAMRSFLFHLFPKPTLTFYLYNTPEVLYERKHEQSVEELRRQMDLFEKMSQKLQAFKVKTDNEEKVIAAIAKNIFEYLTRRGNE